LSPARPDGSDLLRWTIEEDGPRRYGQLSKAAQAGISEYLSDSAGSTGSLIMACVTAGKASMALPVGLALKVIHAPKGELAPALVAANARLEILTQGRPIDAAAARSWIDGAEAVVRSLDQSVRQTWLARGDGLLDQIQARAYASASDLSPQGFEDRLQGFATVLQRVLRREDDEQALTAAAALCEGYILAATSPGRMQRLLMATRLTRWLR
jgi:hypothetical protein